MKYSPERLRQIFDRTSGYCHLCGKKLSFRNYGRINTRGAWEVEHSNPRINGGSDHLNNLYPAHIRCNREKCDLTTRTARAWNDRSKAPLSLKKRKEAKIVNTVIGAGLGLVLGSLFGPAGRLICSAMGAYLGRKINPDT